MFGDNAEAVPNWERGLALDPDYLPARVKLGEVLLKANRQTEAEAGFQAVLARELGEEGRARMLRARQKHHGAYQAVRDPWINELNDDGFDAYQLSLESGAASFRGNDADALRWIERALELDPNNGNLHHQAAKLWEKQRNQVKAKAEYEKTVELDPTIADAWARLITLYKAIWETGTALRAMRTVLEVNPNSGVLLLERGRAYKERGRMQDALADFKRVVEVRHDDETGYVESAQVLFALDRREEGVAMLERSLNAEPENPFSLMMLTFTAITNGDWAAADRWFKRVVAQPRVTPQDRARLAAGYEQVFGEPPSP